MPKNSLRPSRLSLFAIYVGPLTALTVLLIQFAIREANPDVSLATFFLIRDGIPWLAVGAHVLSFVALLLECGRRLWHGLPPCWSLVPALIYFSLAVVLLLIALLSEGVQPIEWAI